MKILIIGFLTFFQTFNSFAMTKDGVTMSDHIQVAGKTLTLNGIGFRLATIFKVKVYAAGLYLEEKSRSGDDIIKSHDLKKVEMSFLHSVSEKDVRGAWMESFKKNGHKDSALEERVKQLTHLLSQMKEGDKMSYTFLPESVEISVQGQKRGEIQGRDFSQFLLTTWLGQNPPNPELKAGMLGE